jgi:hypothetical protein
MKIVFAQVFLFLSNLSAMIQSKRIIDTPDWLKNKTNAKIKLLPNIVLERDDTLVKKLTTDDFKTLMQIWATMFIFTFPIIIIPYNSGERR